MERPYIKGVGSLLMECQELWDAVPRLAFFLKSMLLFKSSSFFKPSVGKSPSAFRKPYSLSTNVSLASELSSSEHYIFSSLRYWGYIKDPRVSAGQSRVFLVLLVLQDSPEHDSPNPVLFKVHPPL